MGRSHYLLFYLICGCVGTLAHAGVNPASQVPLVGASGAISGVIAAYILIWPRANIRVFYWFFIFIGTISVPAFVVLGLWFVEQIIALPAAMRAQGGHCNPCPSGRFYRRACPDPVSETPRRHAVSTAAQRRLCLQPVRNHPATKRVGARDPTKTRLSRRYPHRLSGSSERSRLLTAKQRRYRMGACRPNSRNVEVGPWSTLRDMMGKAKILLCGWCVYFCPPPSATFGT